MSKHSKEKKENLKQDSKMNRENLKQDSEVNRKKSKQNLKEKRKRLIEHSKEERRKLSQDTKRQRKELSQIAKEKKKKVTERRKCNKGVLQNMICAVIIMSYFIALNLVNNMYTPEILKLCIQISYMTYLVIAIIIIEIAYKKNSNKLALHGVESIIIAIYILLMETIITTFNFDTSTYIVFSSYIFPVYYTFKAIIIETRETRNKLKQLSDIKEIVKKEKPSKKVAKKRII